MRPVRTTRARLWPLAAIATLALLVGACQLVVDLNGLEDQHCPPRYKACPGIGCVSIDDPATGCSDVGCAACAPAHAIAACGQNGHCFFDRNSCIGDWDDCDGRSDNGCETDLAHRPDHCGSCTTTCPTPMNGSAGCYDRVCGIGGCFPGYEDCDHDPSTGCEHKIWTDQECLTCGLPCAEGTHCAQGGVCL